MGTTPIQEQYDDGACPDCGLAIPDNAVEGSACANCGHVFNAEGGDN